VTVWAVVVAAGSGERFGSPKQFAVLGGRPLYRWALEAARSVADGVVLVVPAGWRAPADAPPGGAGAPGGVGAVLGADVVVEGGSTRAASVRAGLAAVPGGAEVVVVHDAARPLATSALFRSVVDAVRAGADGAVPGLAVADTLKHVEDGTVVATLERRGVVAVQTPQAFSAQVLRAAHDGGAEATDDAALVEARGGTVRVVPGDPRNLKVTTPADLEVVAALVDR
jgi:2-C-methyl-D-erythritol 4-phosphate cytidylyltransferase